MLSTGEWISLVGSLAAAAVSFGVLSAKVAAISEALRELRESCARSNEDQGRRLGSLERWQEAVREVEKERRRARTGAITVPAEGSDDE